MDLEHDLNVRHQRTGPAVIGRTPASSAVDVSATSTDLTEAWRELLSRLPSDLYAALKAAMPSAQGTLEEEQELADQLASLLRLLIIGELGDEDRARAGELLDQWVARRRG